MGVMVESFRDSVERWLGAPGSRPLSMRACRAAYRSEPMCAPSSMGMRAWLERESFRDRIADTPVNLTRVTVHGRWPGALDEVLLAGRWDGEGALISEPLARTLGLPLESAGLGGASIALDAGQGSTAVPVAGVYREYGGGRGSVSLPAARWPAVAAGAISFEIFDVEDIDALVADLTEALPLVPRCGAIGRSSTSRWRSSIAPSESPRCCRPLRVSSPRSASSVRCSPLRSKGGRNSASCARWVWIASRPRWPVSASPYCLQALVTALLALPVGVLVAHILLDVVNVRAFGWSLDLALTPGLLLEALGVAVLAGLIAALVPAWRLHGTSPAQLLAHARVL